MDVFCPELHDSIGSGTSFGILQAHRLQRTELHGLAAPFSHHFDRDTTFKIGRLFKFVWAGPFPPPQGFIEVRYRSAHPWGS